MKKNNQDLVALIGFLEYYLPIIDMQVPTKIDEGGCGFFAKHLHLNLKKMGFENKLMYCIPSDSDSEMEKLQANNSYVSDKNFGVHHVMVMLNDYIALDNGGIAKPFSLYKELKENVSIGELTVEQLDALWNHVESWNKVFDRDCEQQIIDLLNELPAKYERFLLDGYLDKPSTKDVPLTDKTVKVLKEQREMESFLQIMGSLR